MDFTLPGGVELAASILFAIAVIHTFSTKYFEYLAHRSRHHAGLWKLLGEVEAVFGFWAFVLLGFIALYDTPKRSVEYLDGRNFTEPAFVFVIMVIAASRPILRMAEMIIVTLARLLPLPKNASFYAVALSVGPLLGSFITEPAAMTLVALVLRDRFFTAETSNRFKYATLGVLFVNISIGGALTPFAAPPILMVAGTWGWDLHYVISTFGLRATIAVLINAAAIAFLFRRDLKRIELDLSPPAEGRIPLAVTVAHIVFLAGVVFYAHHPIVFLGLFLLFIGFTHAYERYQSPLILREGLMVGFFLAGLVTLGGLQQWWLQPLLAGLDDTVLYFGATALTAITDNAALTYLGSLVQGTSEEFRYSLVAGALTGGGLTVIANAPNPAGYSILKGKFEDEAIGAGGLFVAALGPTFVAILAFKGDALIARLF